MPSIPLLDPFLSRLRQRISPTATVGAPGTAIYGGYVVEDERSQRLSSREERYRTYSDILANLSIVNAGVRYFLNLIGNSGWTFTPSEKDTDAMYAELLEAILTKDPMTPFHRIVRRAAMYRFYGFSVQEWTAKRHEDGHLTYLDIAPRAQSTIERWDTDKSGNVMGIIQESPQSYEELYLPRNKVLYVVDDSLSDSPEGLGLFRQLVAPAERLLRYEQLEGFGFETDLRGIPVARIPYEELEQARRQGLLTDSQVNQLTSNIEEFVHKKIRNPDLAVALESSTYTTQGEQETPSAIRKWDVEILTGDSVAFAENAAAIERLNREIARILGVEQLLLGSDVGSYALSKDKTNAFHLMVEGALKDVREAIEKDLVDIIWTLNGWDEEMKPEIMTEAIKDSDVNEIVAALRELATAGAPLRMNDPAELEVRAMLGVSPPPEDEEPEEDEDEFDDDEDEAMDEDEDMEALEDEEEDEE